MNVLKPLSTGLLACLLVLAGGVEAAANTPTVQDPGPAGDFNWEGFNWEKRSWGGAPHYNGRYDPANVSNPDTDGHVTLSLSNPTGTAPKAAEFQSTRQGFGYGTYSTVVEKDVSALQKEAVWGCLFTYDSSAPPGHNEIDLCEASAWGGGGAYGESWPVEQGHGYWFDASRPPGQGNNTINFPASMNQVLTHKMIWSPGKIVFETYAGANYVGPLIKRTVLEGSNVPVPAKERVIFNLWVTGGGGGTPDQVKPESVTIRDFTFTPADQLPPTGSTNARPLAISGTASQHGNLKRSTVKWAGARTAMVTLLIDGRPRRVLNTGSYTVTSSSVSGHEKLPIGGHEDAH